MEFKIYKIVVDLLIDCLIVFRVNMEVIIKKGNVL